MSRPVNPCTGDCFRCPLPDCTCSTEQLCRRTPFEREQSAIRREKADRAKAEAARRREIEAAFLAWKRRNGIGGYRRRKK